MRWLAFLLVTIAIGVAAGPAMAAAPAGYVVEADLPGGEGSGAVIRDGQEVPVKLLMPVFDGDVVFVRGGAGRIVLELGAAETVVIGPEMPRLEVRGEIATGDDTWSLISALAEALSGESAEAPDNLAARGDATSIVVAAAGRGRNLLPRGLGEVGLEWSGGTGPYRISLEGPAGKTLLAETAEARAVLPLASAVDEKFAITIEDSRSVSRRLRFAHFVSDPFIEDYAGRMAEFGSVVDAVECAVVLQRGMAERNAGLAEAMTERSHTAPASKGPFRQESLPPASSRIRAPAA